MPTGWTSSRPGSPAVTVARVAAAAVPRLGCTGSGPAAATGGGGRTCPGRSGNGYVGAGARRGVVPWPPEQRRRQLGRERVVLPSSAAGGRQAAPRAEYRAGQHHHEQDGGERFRQLLAERGDQDEAAAWYLIAVLPPRVRHGLPAGTSHSGGVLQHPRPGRPSAPCDLRGSFWVNGHVPGACGDCRDWPYVRQCADRPGEVTLAGKRRRLSAVDGLFTGGVHVIGGDGLDVADF